jgi:hypothetical protein
MLHPLANAVAAAIESRNSSMVCAYAKPKEGSNSNNRNIFSCFHLLLSGNDLRYHFMPCAIYRAILP